MEILTPSHPPAPTGDRCSRFLSSSSMASYGAELERRPSRVVESSFRSLSGIVEEEEEEGRREKVYVAVGKSKEKTFALLLWTIRNFRSSEICLLHVHQPSPVIPTLLGKLPATQANAGVVAAYRREEREQTKKLLLGYLNICHSAEVKASSIMTEAEQVQKGLVDMALKHGIKKLVMGSVPENCVKGKKGCSKATYTAINAPAFCEIWFIYKGRHIWTREAFEDSTIAPNCQADNLDTEPSRSKSFRYDKSERQYNPDHLRSFSSRLSLQCSGMKDWIKDDNLLEHCLPPASLCSSINPHENHYARSSTSNDSSSSTSTDRRVSSESDSKLEEENLYGQLLEAKADAETSKNEALVELLKCKELEAEAVQAIKKVKDIESACTHEAKLRKEAEDALRSMMEEEDRLLEERLELTGELQKTMRNIAVLDRRVQEAKRRCEEAAEELKLIQVCIPSLQQEKEKIKSQKIEAERWLERWRSRRQGGGTHRNGYGGFLHNVPELVEFSLLDLQTATCNFSDSFKIGEGGGYGHIYKGELLGRTVAIQRLPAHNIQGPSEFQKQVQILGKLRHPYLLNLIGSCPDAWSLVYEYVPNGPLQERLFHRSNIAPLPWKIRARIISEISTALLFLHSSHPEKIIHGDLKPENILLDSDLHCKICDFGISRLLTEETLRCPSFRRCAEPKGAFPYSDPEYHRTGNLSPKSDVYSFGIIILQLLTGQPPGALVGNVRRAFSCGKLASILDSSAGDWEPFVAEKLTEIALRFCEPNSRDRPEMTPSLVKELQQLHNPADRPVPSFFQCPILQEIMRDPQVAADGFTYEGEAIREWLENGRETSPMTNLRLDHLHLTPNHALRLAIQEWLCKY